ncbi:hypothetical protein H310_15170, partial [Aphanomyces invadans]
MELNDMMQFVHLDEKWFYLTKTTRKYYLPFVESIQAQRDSANRAAGTYETKSVVVTNDVYRTFLIDKVLPSIVAKWPCPDRNVKLQHDNARAHVTPFDATVLAAFANYSTA